MLRRPSFLVCMMLVGRAAGAAELSVPDGDVTALRNAIEAANATPEADTITLALGSLYSITEPAEGSNGLPKIEHSLTIEGNEATIERAPDAEGFFRILSTALAADVTLRNVTIRGGRPAGVIGGAGISAGGRLTIEGSRITDNRCACLGGGIDADFELIIRDSVINGNSADLGGGIFVGGGTPVTIERSRIGDNLATGSESSHGGGGLFTAQGSTVSIVDSTFEGNRAETAGSTGSAFGGGIAAGAASGSGTWTIVRSAITNNRAFSSGKARTLGGGIAGGGQSTFIIDNSTIAFNDAWGVNNDGNDGGGMAGVGGSTWTLNNVTVADNNRSLNANGSGTDLPVRGGGIYVNTTGSMTARNSIIARNVAGAGPDCFTQPERTLDSGGHLLLGSSADCAFVGATGDVTSVDPLLGPLDDNGGLTPTRALAPGSPAIDAGSPSPVGSGGDACEAVDQRCYRRPVGARCDMGAFEADASVVCIPTATTLATTTTTTTLSTATTTLPGGCVESTPTFASIDCRIAAFLERLRAATSLGRLQARLVAAAESARTNARAAGALMGSRKSKAVARKLKKCDRQLTRLVGRLESRKAVRSISEGLRRSLLADVAPIRTAVALLRDQVTQGRSARIAPSR